MDMALKFFILYFTFTSTELIIGHEAVSLNWLKHQPDKLNVAFLILGIHGSQTCYIFGQENSTIVIWMFIHLGDSVSTYSNSRCKRT